jgi:hypothetical protein
MTTWPSLSEFQLAHIRRTNHVRDFYDQEVLAAVCEMAEADFGETYNMQTVTLPEGEYPDLMPGENFFYYKNNDSSVLAVAHLDTVMPHWRREASFVDTEDGPVIFSGALDDRLGAYVILELLPALGLEYDILLTVGEESGASTAQYFLPPEGKEYDWIIEFDRGGTDVVMYQYEDSETSAMVRRAGGKVSPGAFSDISYLEHLKIKAFNWGVGYRDYHGPRSHAFLEDTFEMVAKYLLFHEQNEGTAMVHYPRAKVTYGSGYSGRSTFRSYSSYDDDEWEQWWAEKKREEAEQTHGTEVAVIPSTIAAALADAGVLETPEGGEEDNPDFVENPTMEQINAALAAMEETA